MAWSAATANGTARAAGSSVTIPAASGGSQARSLLFSEASYAYTPAVGYTISGTLTLSDQMYMAPRISAPSYGDATRSAAPDRYAVCRASWIGSAVVDLIRSMAKREVTFFSGTVAISFL